MLRRVLATAAALLLLTLIAGACRLAVKDWRATVPCAASGAPERRLLAEFSGEAPAELRYGALFRYFARGFVDHLDANGSRAEYCGAPSNNTRRMSGLEGFARTAPLLAAWVHSGREARIDDPASGGRIDTVAVLRRGILAGVDPRSAGYWGAVTDNDQRIVEAADIARVLWMTRTLVWDRLSDGERRLIVAWLVPAARAATPPDNWMLFPVVVSLVLVDLQAVPRTEFLDRAHRAFDAYRRLYVEAGWFRDPPNGVDFYNAWGISYDLFWIQRINADFEPQFIGPALADSAALTSHLISPRGIPIMGRSICYRTAVPVPLVAESLLSPHDPAAAPASRALDVVWRHFLRHGAVQEGALSQGYWSADLRFLDPYSGTGSCQWGLRSLTLAFLHAADDAFWTSPAEPLPVETADFSVDHPKLGWTISGRRASGDITIAVAGNERGTRQPQPYTTLDRALEIILRRPLRPHNHAVKYESGSYSTSPPFPAT